MKKLLMVIYIFSVSVAFAQGRLLKRVAQQADRVAESYGETWNTFFGIGHYKTLMKAELDVRPDGTPNIVLDENAGKMDVTIRLSVNEPNYNAWKDVTHKRFKDANMSFEFSDFEDPEGRMIGGKNYKFGNNEKASIERWEAVDGHVVKAGLTVRVRIVDLAKKIVRETYVPIGRFGRLGFASFPFPLHNLNRLKDLPVSRFHWFYSDKDPKTDPHCEDAYTELSYEGFSKVELDSLDTIECVIFDEADMKRIIEEERERKEKDRIARENQIAAKAKVGTYMVEKELKVEIEAFSPVSESLKDTLGDRLFAVMFDRVDVALEKVRDRLEVMGKRTILARTWHSILAQVLSENRNNEEKMACQRAIQIVAQHIN